MTAPETTAAVERLKALDDAYALSEVYEGDADEQMDHLCADLRTLLALAAQPPTDGGWEPTHRHVKRGSDYQAMGTAHVQISTDDPIQEDDVLMIYRDKAGQLWARRDSEFFDGRFAPLPVRPEQGEVK